jgi:NAD(P)-dependent dehydrogenase (short-subunit alcohol dehydrogenase family)
MTAPVALVTAASKGMGAACARELGGRATVPAARYGRADELAKTVAFLLTADAGYVTGPNVRVDGGATRSV